MYTGRLARGIIIYEPNGNNIVYQIGLNSVDDQSKFKLAIEKGEVRIWTADECKFVNDLYVHNNNINNIIRVFSRRTLYCYYHQSSSSSSLLFMRSR